DLTAAERNRVDTYLALKYGITLTDTQGISYTLSDGTSIVWDADDNDTYHNDVAGIVIDAGSALTQTQSRSVNPGSLVTITGNIANMADGHALVWGNNAADATTFDQSAGAFVHMARVWKVQEQGDVGAVTVAGPTSATYVLVSSSTDFSSPTVHNVGDDIDFNDGQYFTFAQDRTCSLISSTFDTDNEGWSTTPDGQIQAWNGTAGNPGGAFLVNDGQTGGWFDYVAPAKFLGDQSIFYGGTLNFDLYVTAGGGAAGAAQISDGTTTLSFGGATSIGNYTWTSYTATLTAADWGTTEAEMRQVLSNLAWIWIQGEYIGIAAHGRLDNVFMTCPPPPTPGGVSTDLDLWLKADAGVYANAGTILATDGDNVLQWHTQAGNITTEAQIAATSNITYETATANFNPVVQFDGTSLQRLRGLSTKDFSGAATILLVAKDEGTPNDVLGVFSSVGTPTANAGGQGIYAREHGKYIIDGQGAWDPNSANTTLPSADRYRMVTGYYSDTGTTQDSSIYLDGGLEQNYTGAGVPIDSGMTFEIGGRTWGVGAAYESRIFTGEIAEVIYYGKQLDAADQNKAESYLALKYGITLISGTQGISYTLSDDMVVWNADANAAYHNDVAGISIDGGSALAQTMSRSINDDSIVTIGMPADLDDGEALVWGNDNGVLTGTTEVPATYYRRLAREWLVQETDDAGNVYIDFDLSGISDSPDFGNVAGFALLVDSDGDFGDATAITAAGVNGSIVYFNNVSLADGDYFSLAYPKVGDGVDPITGIEIDYGPGTPGENAITATLTTGEPVSYTWDISGTIITDNPISYTFPGPGVYPCVLTVTNPISEVVHPFEIIITGDNTLSIDKTAEDVNGAPLEVGDELLYTVVVTNNLSGDHPGVVITDAIPANTTYVPASASVMPGSISNTDPVVANVGTLPGGGSATLTFRVSVDAGATGETIQNSAVADSPVQEPEAQVGPIEPPGGGLVGPTGGPITGIEIDYGPGTPGENAITGTITTGGPATYTWDISGTIIIDNPITYTFPGPGVYPCVLTVTNPVSEVVKPFEIIITGDSTLGITKTAEDLNNAPLYEGDELLYTVVVTNLLSGDHPGVVITDAIPANTTYVPDSASVVPGSISSTDPVVANVGTLPGGGSATLTFRVSVDAGATDQEIQNSAVADSPVQEPQVQVGPIVPPGGGTVIFPTGRPLAVDDAYDVPESVSAQPSSMLMVLENDSDPDGDIFTIVQITAPAHGTAAIAEGGGYIIYTPTADYLGADTFGYTINDGVLEDSAVVTLNVLPVADLSVDGTYRGTISTDNFTLMVRNDGPRAADGAVVTMSLPVSYTVSSCDADGVDCMANIVNNVLSDTLTLMPSGSVVTYTLTGSMPDSRESSTAVVMPPDGVFDVVMENNIDVSWTLYKVICPITAKNATF
ncbi:MAG: DUF11 domain-containing protein, partial [Chloroflexi bacterium]|nr:DUF11 domain-containing protein [Chloroflexota bacterium]